MAGNLIVGQVGRSAIGPLVDRHTGHLRLIHHDDRNGAAQLRVMMPRVLTALPAVARWTVTLDQGAEMAHHDLFTEYLADRIVCSPQSMRAWHEERPRALRAQHFAKDSDLRAFLADDLRAVEEPRNEPWCAQAPGDGRREPSGT